MYAYVHMRVRVRAYVFVCAYVCVRTHYVSCLFFVYFYKLKVTSMTLTSFFLSSFSIIVVQLLEAACAVSAALRVRPSRSARARAEASGECFAF